MKTIIWIQRKSTDEDDIISVDGMRVDKEAPTYQNTYDKLNDDKFVRLYKSDDLQIFKHTSKKTHKIHLLIYSCFNEKDASNRNVPFMARCNDIDNVDEAISLLMKESELYNYSIDDNILKKLKSFHTHKTSKRKVWGLFFIILLIISCLTILICRKYGK